MKFQVFGRFGNSHGHYYGEIDSDSAKKAFKIAVNTYFDMKKYSSYTEFYVYTSDNSVDPIDNGYGYDIKGQSNSISFRSSAKWIIDNVYEIDYNLNK